MLDWDYSLDSDGNHKAAARILADRQGWKWPMSGGGIEHGMAVVFVTESALREAGVGVEAATIASLSLGA